MQMPVLTWPHPHFGLGFVSFWESRRIEGNPVGPRPGSESRGAGKKSSPDPTSHCDGWALQIGIPSGEMEAALLTSVSISAGLKEPAGLS